MNLPESKPSRIAWLIEGDEPFGALTMISTLAETFEGCGGTPGFVCLKSGPAANRLEQTYPGRVRVIGAPEKVGVRGPWLARAFRMGWNALTRLKSRKTVALVLDSLDAEALHVLWPTLVPLAGYLSRSRGLTCTWESPGDLNADYPLDIGRRFLQWECRRSGIRPIAISAHTASTFWSGEPRPEIIHLSADPRRFNPDDDFGISSESLRSSLGIPPDAIVVGSMARVQESKGQLLVAKAIAEYSRAHPGERALMFLCIGNNTEPEYGCAVRDVVGNHGVFLDTVDNPASYYRAMDLYVNARLEPEPFGLSIVEAMLMEIPCLAHALGGPAETVLDGVSGWHIPPTEGLNSSDILQGLTRAMADADRWDRMGTAARHRATEQFSPSKRLASILELHQ